MILEGNTVIFTDDIGTTRLDLRLHTQLAGIIGSVRSALAGDRRALELYYRLNLQGTLQAWELELLPDDEHVARYVRRILVSGSRQDVTSFEVEQADGDRSITKISPLHE